MARYYDQTRSLVRSHELTGPAHCADSTGFAAHLIYPWPSEHNGAAVIGDKTRKNNPTESSSQSMNHHYSLFHVVAQCTLVAISPILLQSIITNGTPTFSSFVWFVTYNLASARIICVPPFLCTEQGSSTDCFGDGTKGQSKVKFTKSVSFKISS